MDTIGSMIREGQKTLKDRMIEFEEAKLREEQETARKLMQTKEAREVVEDARRA